MNAHVRAADLTASQSTIDPLEAIIVQLAQVERRRRTLRLEDVKARLEQDEDRMFPEDLDRQLSDQCDALRRLAGHLKATSPAGATLQLLLALHVALPDMAEHVTSLGRADARRFSASQARLERLLYSAIYSDNALDEDLRLLRDTMAPRAWNGLALVEELDVTAEAAA